MSATAGVFAYHNVGVRCLATLLAHGVKVPLVLTHQDSPGENIWFGSVAQLARDHDIPVITPEDANQPEVLARLRGVGADYFFSFYYRQVLKPELLALAAKGAYNMHGSLLPHYRGRVPVNWAIIRGEGQTGASLHEMVEKPDAGRLVDQQAVPILPDDTALDVFTKVTVAAEICLDRALPKILDGSACPTPLDLRLGNYCKGRKPEDGCIDWHQPARDIHNLIRAVAPPYPGAFTDLGERRLFVLKSLPQPERSPLPGGPGLYVEGDRLFADCGDGQVLRLLAAILAPGQPRTVDGLTGLLTAEAFTEAFGRGKIAR